MTNLDLMNIEHIRHNLKTWAALYALRRKRLNNGIGNATERFRNFNVCRAGLVRAIREAEKALNRPHRFNANGSRNYGENSRY